MPLKDPEKAKEYARLYYLKNKERIFEPWREKNRDKLKKQAQERHSERSKEDREKIKNQAQEYREKNRDKLREQYKKHYETHKKEIKEKRKKAFLKNPKEEKIKSSKRHKRWRKKNKEKIKLSNSYIKNIITRNSKVLKYKDISEEFVNFYRSILILKRTVKQLKEKENEQSQSTESHELRGSHESNLTDCCRCY